MKMKFSAYGIGVFLSVVGLLYLFSTQRAGSQNPREWQVLAEGGFIHEPRFSHVSFFDKESGIVLSGLSIKRSSDGGKTWDEVSVKGAQGFYSLVVTDKRSGWAVGSGENGKPLVMRTNDKGLTWQKVNFDAKGLGELDRSFTGFSDVCFDPVGKGWIVGNDGVVEATGDESSGQKAWRVRRAGDSGIVEAVTDGQNLKVASVFFTKEPLSSISCGDSGEVWAVGEDGGVFHYRNGWSRKEVDKKYIFERVLLKGGDVWLLGGEVTTDEKMQSVYPRPGILLRSKDGGRTWENKTPGSASMLYDLYLKDKKGWLIGAEGSIFHSGDDGHTWRKLKGPTQNDLTKIFFLDSSNGWVSGDRATILSYQN